MSAILEIMATSSRYVYVNEDGSSRELHPDERADLEADRRRMAEGHAPELSVKSSYEQRNGWGDLSGYLERSMLPAGMQVSPAPAEDPSLMSRDDLFDFLRAKGVDVERTGDREFRIRKKR